ncbi:protein phosphatase 1H-like [Notothenia coriiceps]|uniref:Protein phosphatase 1H-like n=1 Tax=Notothenia coriiceps TaxID=8208 RepID=A0A6I9N2R7_9TELE|nr:PREDICTED: protein phosphatase 1H-like [Notothenia coriiceps]
MKVINAGKSALNEDQACCEVLVVKRRPSGCSTPNRTSLARRRSSLPNGEGLSPRDCNDSSEELTLHYWAMFDGHAGSGVAVMASRLLHHHVALHLQEVLEIICTPNLLPPTCLGEEPINHHLTPTSQRALTRAASLRGAAGAPGSPSNPPTRFFTEKKVSHESLVVGAIENAFKDMVFSTGSEISQRQSPLVSQLLTNPQYFS